MIINAVNISILIGITCVLLICLLLLYALLQKKVGPNEALIIFGRKGTKIITGGSGFVNPITHQYKTFSLELMSFPVEPETSLYTSQGIPVEVKAIAQIKVKSSSYECIRIAAEQFLSKSQEERILFIRQVLEGHLRNTLGHLQVEDLISNADYVANQVITNATPDIEKMGLEIMSFTFTSIQDHHNYIQHLSQTTVENARKNASIMAAQTSRDIRIKQAQLEKEAEQAEAQAAQERVESTTKSRIKQAADEHALALKRIQLEEEQSQHATAALQNHQQREQKTQQTLLQMQLTTEQQRGKFLRAQAENDAAALHIRGEAENTLLETHIRFIQQLTQTGVLQLVKDIFPEIRNPLEQHDNASQSLLETSEA